MKGSQNLQRYRSSGFTGIKLSSRLERFVEGQQNINDTIFQGLNKIEELLLVSILYIVPKPNTKFRKTKYFVTNMPVYIYTHDSFVSFSYTA